VAPLAAALDRLLRLRADAASLPDGPRFDVGRRIDQKEEDLLDALTLAQGLSLEVVADQGDVAPGETFGVAATVANQGTRPLTIQELALAAPSAWRVDTVSQQPGLLGPGSSARFQFKVQVGADAAPTRPYWHLPPGADRYAVDIPADEGRPWSPPALTASLRYLTDGGTAAHLESPAIVRFEGRFVGGERRKVVNVVPALSVGLSPAVAVVPAAPSAAVAPRELRVSVVPGAVGLAEAVVRLVAPSGWRVEPREVKVPLGDRGQERVALFRVSPPAAAGASEALIRAVATAGGRDYDEGYRVVAYDHIQERHVFRQATARLVPVDVRTGAGLQIGYVMGTGDEVAKAIGALGVPVTLLGESDLLAGDLSRYSTIVTGVRAYQVRRDLRGANRRLLRYVEDGGHLVVQYNRLDFNQGAAESPFAPYPGFAVTGERVTDETAPVRVLWKDRVLEAPNVLASSDWDGWVQERGLQFAKVGDPRYLDLLGSADPFPLNPGEKTGLLVVAAVGKGTWTYTGLSLFRQLPAGVPGAYRLLANLISRPRARP